MPGRLAGVGEGPGGRSDLFHERPASQHAFVERPALAAPAEGREAGPAPRAAAKAAPLQVGPVALGQAFGDEGPVPLPGRLPGGAELAQDLVNRLPRGGPAAHEGAMAAPAVPVEVREVPDEPGPEGIHVDVARQATADRIPSSRRSPSTTPSTRCTA